jgi:hypothetical protein
MMPCGVGVGMAMIVLCFMGKRPTHRSVLADKNLQINIDVFDFLASWTFSSTY